MSLDHVALLPGYLAAATALAAFVVDLIVPGRRAPVLLTGAGGTVAAGVAAVVVGAGHRRATFCVPGGTLPGHVRVGQSCSLVADHTGAAVAVLFCVLTLLVLGLSAGTLGRSGPPPGEYVFLLAASLTGGVLLGYSRDLITLAIALETLTLPLYALVALGRRHAVPAPASAAPAEVASAGTVRSPGEALAVDGMAPPAASGAVTFFVVSVVSTAVTLMGAALLYALTGAVHLDRIAAALAARADLRHLPLLSGAVVLVLVGLAFKLAAVPCHGWAPASYDGAPLPVAGYLSTASKLGGVVALLYVAVDALAPRLDLVGPVLAALAVASMTVGNVVALRQRRMVRLLAWSSIAQAGYLLAPLGAFALAAGRSTAAVPVAVAGTLGYTAFYVLLELGAFGAVIALRGGADGGELADYRGLGRRAPLRSAALVLALVGLAGLPPGLAGLFAKVTIVHALLGTGGGWLAVVVGLNAVIGLAYYLRPVVLLYRPATPDAVAPHRAPVPVGVALAAVTAAAVLVGLLPQPVLDAARSAAALFR